MEVFILRKVAILGIFLTGMVLFSREQAQACMCYKKLQPSEAYEKASTVVLATVVENKLGSIPYDRDGQIIQIPTADYTIKINNTFKGASKETAQILSRKLSCEKKLDVGATYVLYLRETQGQLIEITLCDRVVKQSEAAEDEQFLSKTK